MNKTLLTTVLTLILTSPVLAQQPNQTITLKDGTTIKGQLINVANGSYTIESPTMGQVTVPADQVVNIGTGATGTLQTTPDGKISENSINAVKNNMMQDPAIMSLVQELIQDPEVAELMKNPALMQDALSMDPEKVANNPDVQKLLQNPIMQKIIALTAGNLQNQ